jgi:hypothetical protein
LSRGSKFVCRTAAGDEWVFLYEWFAGWRWEHYCAGSLHDETLESYETIGDCMANATARGYRSPRIASGRSRIEPVTRADARPGTRAFGARQRRAA